MTPAEEFSALVHELAQEMIYKAGRRTVTIKSYHRTNDDPRRLKVSPRTCWNSQDSSDKRILNVNPILYTPASPKLLNAKA
jgi:hypothetical protein